MNLQAILKLFQETFKEWSEDKASRLAAALAYYTIFSIAPLLIIVIAIAGALWRRSSKRSNCRTNSRFSRLDGARIYPNSHSECEQTTDRSDRFYY